MQRPWKRGGGGLKFDFDDTIFDDTIFADTIFELYYQDCFCTWPTKAASKRNNGGRI